MPPSGVDLPRPTGPKASGLMQCRRATWHFSTALSMNASVLASLAKTKMPHRSALPSHEANNSRYHLSVAEVGLQPASCAAGRK